MWIKCKDEFRNEGLPVFVKIFTVKKRLIRCELKITATGIFGVKVNGKTLSDRFMPGWSNYRKHIDVCTYDITEYLTDGSENEIAVTVANGWYSGKLGYGNKTNVFGKEKRLLASIFLVYENGDTEKIESDESWKTIVSDVVSADFFDGEIIDAGRRKAMKQSGNAVKAEFSVPLQNYEREPVCVTERIKPQLVYGDETTLRYDFGYNFAGGVKVIAKGRKGSRIVVKYGETLDENGNVYTANLRRAKCTDEFILSGEEDVFEPEFTYHGFKYAELRKTRETEILSIEGAVFSQNINYYGKFECSDEVTNGVWRMALRGQKSNFISIPTDCPQRDERLGWTGDAEVFCNSAMFNADCNLFFKNYLKLVREDALPDGKIPSIVPFYMPLADNTAGVPGWGDCITVIPYFHYLHYRDKSVIVDNFPVAEKWIAYYLAKSENYLTKITNNFGDWLSVHGDSDPDVINQCFFGYSVALMAKMCEILGLHNKSIAYRELFGKCKKAFRENFYHDGRIRSDTQTMYAFAYIAGYLSKEETAARLPEKIRENGGGLTTGFIGTRFLLPALCDIGETKLAYSLIMRTEYPSWGYMLKNGATTVWERWNGYTRENGFEDPEMNSFNHYSLGSCVEWLYSYVLGIKLSPETEKVMINPSFCELLSFAKGETQLKSGKISVYWKYENASVCLEVKADDGIEYEIDDTGKKIISMIRTGNDTIAVFRAQ